MSVQSRQSYVQDQVLHATPQELVILLYDGAIRSLEEGKKHAGDRDLFHYNRLLTKAQAIIAELMAALRPELNPEVSANLVRLYEFMHAHLAQAVLKRDTGRIDETAALLRGLRETWREAIEKSAMAEPVRIVEPASKKTLPKEPAFSIEA